MQIGMSVPTDHSLGSKKAVGLEKDLKHPGVFFVLVLSFC